MNPDLLYWVYGLYILASVIWTFLVLSLKLFRGPVFFLVFLPYIIFVINMFNVGTNSVEEEASIFQGTFLSIGLIVMVSLLGWFKNMGDLSRRETTLILLSLALALLTHIDMGFPSAYYSIYRHYKSILQTFSIVLFLIVIGNYFMIEKV